MPTLASDTRNLTLLGAALAAGLRQRCGLPVIDPHAPPNEQSVQRSIDAAGRDYARSSLVDLAREALRIEAQQTDTWRLTPQDAVRSALSTASFTGALSSTFGAALMAAYAAAASSIEGWIVETDVPSFRPVERVGLDGGGPLARLPRTDTAEHCAYSDAVESYSIARYASALVIDEQDIVSDRLGAIMAMAADRGRAAAELRLDLVWSCLMANAALGADGVALFHADHGNLAGDVLADGALAAGVEALEKQALGDRQLNLRPRFLLVPPTLKRTALKLAREQEALGADRMIVRSESRIELGVVDPRTGATHAGSATSWFLASDQGRTVEVGYLEGTGRRPIVRESPITRGGQWGLHVDVKFDVGANALDFRGLYRGNV